MFKMKIMSVMRILLLCIVPAFVCADDCSSLDPSLCTQGGGTPLNLTEAQCGKPCDAIQCCDWTVTTADDFGNFVNTYLNNGTFAFNNPLKKIKGPNVQGALNGIKSCSVNYNTDACFKSVKSAEDSVCKAVSQEVCDGVQKIADVVIAGVTIAYYGECVIAIAAGYLALQAKYLDQAKQKGISPVSVRSDLKATLDCLYDCGAVGKAKLYFGIDTVCNCPQTFGDNIFIPPKISPDYDTLISTEIGRKTLYHELTHVKQYECEGKGDVGLFGTLYGNAICARVAQGDHLDVDLDNNQAYRNSKYEKEAYAKEEEVANDILAQKCTKGVCIPAAKNLRGYGCNRIDDNCDGYVDDCSEDKIAPTIFVSEYSLPTCFRNKADTENFLLTNTFTEDDCQPIGSTVVSIDSTPFKADQCKKTVLNVVATDGCKNSATDPVMFYYDDLAPTLTINTIPNTCFTNQIVAENIILSSSTATDKCTPVYMIDVSISSFLKKCEDTKVTVKAVDECGNIQPQTVAIKFDDGNPVVKIDQAAVAKTTCYTSTKAIEDAIKAYTTYSDDCTAKGDLQVFVALQEQCEESTATVTVKDKCGNTGSDMVKFNFDNKPPEILVSEYSLGSKWLTNADYAKTFFLTNTFTTDDCSSQAATTVTFTNLVKNCAASTAVITATDKCGNAALDPIMFLYDDVRPTVTVDVAKPSFILSEDKVKKGLVDVGLTIAATDDCTLNPNVTVLVYSDELYDKAVDDWTLKTVQLSRIEAVPGVITGWKLLVAADAFKVCNYGPYFCGGTTKVEGDGRVYTIQVCATDEAGNRYCVEKTVSVGFKKTAAVSGGKLYLLAEDSISKFRTL